MYAVLREQIEEAAMEKGVTVKWSRSMQPVIKHFEAFCNEYISSIGGQRQVGRRQREDDIPAGKIKISLVRRILTKA